MLKVALLVHIVSAIGVFMGLGLLLGALAGLRQATSVEHAKVALAMTSKVKLVFIPGIVLTLLSGLYLMGHVIEEHEPVGWIVVALLSFVVMGTINSSVGDKMGRQLQRELLESKGELSDALRLKARDPRTLTPLVYSLWLVFGILVLMVFQPTTIISIVVVVGAVVAGAAHAHLLSGQKSKPPRS